MPGSTMSLLFPYAAIVLLIASWRSLHKNSQGPSAFFYTTLFSVFFCLLWNWPRLQVFTAAGFYPEDSLYTLGVFKATALASLTAVLLISLAFLSWTVTRGIRAIINLPFVQAIAAATLNGGLLLCVYWLVLSVIPQFYYMIYLQLFPDLPLQWVVTKLIPIRQFVSVLSFSDRPSLSSHAAGLLGWVMVTNAILQWLRRPELSELKTDNL